MVQMQGYSSNLHVVHGSCIELQFFECFRFFNSSNFSFQKLGSRFRVILLRPSRLIIILSCHIEFIHLVSGRQIHILTAELANAKKEIAGLKAKLNEIETASPTKSRAPKESKLSPLQQTVRIRTCGWATTSRKKKKKKKKLTLRTCRVSLLSKG
jgi:hypothetical protein